MTELESVLAALQEHNDLAPHEGCSCKLCRALLEVARLQAIVERLRAIEAALRAIVDWYEQVMERDAFGDEEIGTLRELESALEAAEAIAAQEPQP